MSPLIQGVGNWDKKMSQVLSKAWTKIFRCPYGAYNFLIGTTSYTFKQL